MRSYETLAGETSDPRLKQLLSYAAADPDNDTLLSEIAERALETGTPDIVAELLGPRRDRLSDPDLHLLGLADLDRKAFTDAAQAFASLIDRGVTEPGVRFNLAWALASDKKFKEALEALDGEVTAALPQAAMLEVQLLHEVGEFEPAEAAARRHIAVHPDHEGLAAAVSVLAIDIEDLDLARRAAEKAGGHPDALATLGTLALGEQQAGDALALFDRALEANDQAPRAWIGRGLAHLLARDAGAAADLDRGAALFEDHLGSWIAAGWAHLIAGDRMKARERFGHALALDDTFAEGHGSLAVVDLLDGDDAGARQRMTTALRLDAQCFSGAFARTMLLAAAGKTEQSQELFRKILSTPVNDRGDTAAAALARMSLS